MLPGGCWQRRGAAQGQLTSERDTEGLVAERCSFCALTQGCRDCTSWRQGLRQACLRQRPGDSETRAKFGAHRRTRGCCAMYWGFGATSWGGGALGRASHRGTAKPSHGPWDLGDRNVSSFCSHTACWLAKLCNLLFVLLLLLRHTLRPIRNFDSPSSNFV